jgi:hypothetical protein
MSVFDLAIDAYRELDKQGQAPHVVAQSSPPDDSATAKEAKYAKEVPGPIDEPGLHERLDHLYPLIRAACRRGLHRHLPRVDAEIVKAIISAADSNQDPERFHALCQRAGDAVMLAALIDEYRYQLAMLTALDPDGAFRHAAELELCLTHKAQLCLECKKRPSLVPPHGWCPQCADAAWKATAGAGR